MSRFRAVEEEELRRGEEDYAWLRGPGWNPPPQPRLAAVLDWIRYYGVGLLVVAVLASAGVYLFWEAQSEKDEFSDLAGLLAMMDEEAPPVQSQQTVAAVPERSASLLFVDTEPAGALVLLDDDTLGVTPIAGLSVEAGVYMLAINRPGYASVDTVIIFDRYDPVPELYFTLDRLMSDSRDAPSGAAPDRPHTPRPDRTAAPREARADRTETPSPRADSESGRGLGAADSGDRGTVGEVAAETEALRSGAGDRPTDEEAAAETGASRGGDRSSPVVATGTVTVLVRPWGSIYIDGNLEKLNTDVRHTTTLPVGRYVVRAEHPTLGVHEQVIEVRNEQPLHVVIDLLKDR